MLFGLKTDNPTTELYLYDREGRLVAEETWLADRELAHKLLQKIDSFLAAQGITVHELKGLFVYTGPGSFTGLRIGITVINTLAYSLGVPVVGETGDLWRQIALERLSQGETDKVIMPNYGAEARVTEAKK